MDLLQELRDRIGALPEVNRPGPLEVLRHLEHCERLLHDGRSGTIEFFNDIIYRSNQAFEGALKEAYRTLEGKDPDKVTLHTVEGTFTKNALVRPKIISLMKNYRTEWRNPATHNYTLRFDESEAILAMTSVSAFFLTLLGQIRDKLSIGAAEETVKRKAQDAVHSQASFFGAVTKVIASVFPSLSLVSDSDVAVGKSIELLFAEALSAADSSWKVALEPAVHLKGGGQVRIDMLVSNGDETIPIEIKHIRTGSAGDSLRVSALDQLLRYMRGGGYDTGVLVKLPREKLANNKLVKIATHPIPTEFDDRELQIAEIGYDY